MGLESITDTNGPLGGLKWFAFFGASFFPSLFLAGYFLGGYYPGGVEPSWWPTSMQVTLGLASQTAATGILYGHRYWILRSTITCNGL